MTTSNNSSSHESVDQPASGATAAVAPDSSSAKEKVSTERKLIFFAIALFFLTIVLLLLGMVFEDKASNEEIQNAYGITIVDSDEAEKKQFATEVTDFVTGESTIQICDRPSKDDVKETPELNCSPIEG